ncbi:MAG: hypothetical protein JSR34_04510 [Proteobacteria bacterium]|nr:hypothetical protein [Pseudomonadota bacterium]
MSEIDSRQHVGAKAWMWRIFLAVYLAALPWVVASDFMQGQIKQGFVILAVAASYLTLWLFQYKGSASVTDVVNETAAHRGRWWYRVAGVASVIFWICAIGAVAGR